MLVRLSFAFIITCAGLFTRLNLLEEEEEDNALK
jgi:hypothetical protein